MALTLVLGGARSGKSRFAQSLCVPAPRVVYLATARVEDQEMEARVARHRRERPASWTTVEEPLAIVEAASQHASVADCLLMDCLTLWLSNWCWERREWSSEALEDSVRFQIQRLLAAAGSTRLVVVSNEVGSGLVPESPLGRQFRDLAGLANQQVAAGAESVYWMVAGIPVAVKGGGTRVM